MNQSLPELLTPEEIAKLFKISYHSALDIIKRNFNYVKVGKQYRVSKDEIEKCLNSKVAKFL